MKNLFAIALILLFIPAICHSQDTLTYEQAYSKEVAQLFTKKQNFKVYRLNDNSYLQIGDTIVIGKPASNTQKTTSISGIDGAFTSKIYLTILIGKYGSTNMTLTGPIPLTEGAANTKLSIDNIQLTYVKVSKSAQGIVYLITHSIDNPDMICSILAPSHAIEVGEVINPNGPIKKSIAIEKLKKTKELLDLELISQAEYDSIKRELAPIIMKE